MARRTPESEFRQTLLMHSGGSDRDFSKYRDTPAVFAREALGVRLTPQQESILEAVVRTNRVSVRSGRRIGKTMLIGCIALWFICTRGARAKVVITAPKLGQIDV